MTMTAFANLVLRVDAVANLVLAGGALALLGVLTEAAGLPSGWPLAVLAVVLVANGLVCWRAASPTGPAPRALRGLAEVDAVFTIVVASFALADPTGAVAWLRVVLAGLAIGVAAVAAVKLLVAARLEPGRAAAPRG